MTPSARLAAAAELLALIAASPSPAENEIGSFFRARRYAGSKDRRWVSEFVYKCLRRRGEIDWVLTQLKLDQTPRLQALLALIMFEDVHLQELQQTYLVGPHSLEELTEEEGATLETFTGLDLSTMPPHVVGNFPKWLADKLDQQYDGEAAAIMASYQQRGPVTLRANLLKTTREEALTLFEEADIPVSPTKLSPDGLILEARQNLSRHPLLEKGIVEIQDEAAQISSRLAMPRPGMLVIDYCAGGGGKSLALAAQMQNSGRISAFDINPRRMRDIAGRSRRAGIDILESAVLAQDDSDQELLAGLYGAADRVFVDAPCSGSGTWRRQPDQKWKFSEEKLQELRGLQATILENACQLVASGGRLIYATCSILIEENQHQVSQFLKAQPSFKLLPVQELWEEAGLRDSYTEDYFSVTPADFGSDGFFTAVLERQP
ncbi:MAG: RsmB/NOP family class I SAM-dependent RNA methyltransferase [Proteobacteria bacterium]|nr:RsmB/NOP family class I SAM-dependent RNA methyltransferase [Pseudomonadota bacterium]